MILNHCFVVALIVSVASGLDIVCHEEMSYYHYTGEIKTCIVNDLEDITSQSQEILSVDGSSEPTNYNGLIIQDQVMPFLPKGIGKFFPSLTLLQVTNSQLEEIDKADLADLPQIISLHMEGNELSYLAGDLFENNSALQEVNFSNNKLSQIGDDLLIGLEGLESVNFQDNVCISASTTGAFYEISNSIRTKCQSPRDLKRKYCFKDSENCIKENSALKREIESLKSALEKIKVKFDSCDGNLNAATKNLLIQSKKLKASSKSEDLNLVQKITVVCRAHMESSCRHLTAIGLKIESPGTEVQDFIDENSLKYDGDYCGLIIRYQQTLYLPNKGETFQSLEHLEVAHSGLFHIDAEALANMEHLKSLNLTGNKLRELAEDIFKASTQLESLDLSFNNIERLESGVFKTLTSLNTLNLDHNFLGTIGEGIFDSLKNLQVLSVRDNKLKVICANLFHQLTKLNSVDLSNNVCINSKQQSNATVKEIEAEIIDHCIAPIVIVCSEADKNKKNCAVKDLLVNYPKTKISSVENCDTKEIEAFSASDQLMLFMPFELATKFPKLKEINIQRSKLTTLQQHDFEGLESLTKISITFNNISSIGNGTFDRLQNLEHLSMASNNLHTLPPRIFVMLTTLKTLDLSGNQLKRLPANILRSRNVIEKFEVQKNQLEFVETKIVRYLKTAKLLDLSENICVNLKYEKASNRSSRALVELSGEIDLYCSEDSAENFDP